MFVSVALRRMMRRPMGDAPLLSFSTLATGYRGGRGRAVRVSSGLEGELRPGELVCLLGPNGAGKSTLLNTLSGAMAPLDGAVHLLGRDVHALPPAERARQLAVVSTERFEASLLTGYAFAALGRHPYTDWVGRLTDRDHRVVRWALESTGSAPFSERFVGELSDGERQRVVVSRALAQEPRVLLLDEVTAFLDLPNRVHVMRLLRRLAREANHGVLLSTHDLDLALRAADRIWLLTAEGLTSGAPEDLVLSGAFEEAFRGDDVVFDRRVGAFRIHATPGEPVAVTGAGAALEWTRRALEREGFHVVDHGGEARAHVTIAGENGDTRWLIAGQETETTVTNLEGLVTWTRAHLK